MRITFFGTYDQEIISKSQIFSFKKYLHDYRDNDKSDLFKFAIEEAMGAILQNKQ